MEIYLQELNNTWCVLASSIDGVETFTLYESSEADQKINENNCSVMLADIIASLNSKGETDAT